MTVSVKVAVPVFGPIASNTNAYVPVVDIVVGLIEPLPLHRLALARVLPSGLRMLIVPLGHPEAVQLVTFTAACWAALPAKLYSAFCPGVVRFTVVRLPDVSAPVVSEKP